MGDDNGNGSSEGGNQPPQEMGDAFVAELLDGRPSDAANRLSPIRSELEPQLPGISIQLQSGGYQVKNVRRQGNNAFVYTFEGNAQAQPRTMEWLMTFTKDIGQWGVVSFTPRQPSSTSG